MGIKSNFGQFIKTKCTNAVFNSYDIRNLESKKVAIDTPLYMHKFKYINSEKWLQIFLDMVISLRRMNIHCVYVFDGESPVEKHTEQERRIQQKEKITDSVEDLLIELEDFDISGVIGPKMTDLYIKKKLETPVNTPLIKPVVSQSSTVIDSKKPVETPVKVDMKWVRETIEKKKSQLIHVTHEDYKLVQTLFDILGVPYVYAIEEAEKFCSYLCLNGKVDAVLSEDSDVLAYQCPISISKYNSSSHICTVIVFENILSELDMTGSQFLDLCIMCGTDYNKNIPKIGSITAYKLLIDHGSIENIESNTKFDTSILNYKRTRELFTVFDTTFEDVDIPYCGIPDFESVGRYCSDHGLRINMTKFMSAFEIKVELDDNSDCLDTPDPDDTIEINLVETE